MPPRNNLSAFPLTSSPTFSSLSYYITKW